MLITGTNHFTSFNAALSYYSDYEPDMSLEELAQHVKRKIDDGEICLGAPKVSQGQQLRIIDKGLRWALVEA